MKNERMKNYMKNGKNERQKSKCKSNLINNNTNLNQLNIQ